MIRYIHFSENERDVCKKGCRYGYGADYTPPDFAECIAQTTLQAWNLQPKFYLGKKMLRLFVIPITTFAYSEVRGETIRSCIGAYSR